VNLLLGIIIKLMKYSLLVGVILITNSLSGIMITKIIMTMGILVEIILQVGIQTLVKVEEVGEEAEEEGLEAVVVEEIHVTIVVRKDTCNHLSYYLLGQENVLLRVVEVVEAEVVQ
jgi:hypothetical protein